MSTFDDGLMAQGIEYNVGTSSGFLFKEAIFIGKKMQNGKEMLCFKLHKSDEQLVINPSYMAFSLEHKDNMNDVIYEEGIKAWEGEKKDGKTDSKTG